MGIQLSKRMSALASLVTEGSRLADIGTDHGYIPIALVQKGRIPSALAMDVGKGPLSRAREHIHSQGLDTYIETRLSDGLTELHEGEADTVLIAGMGGMLMTEMLGKDPYKAKSFKKIVLQPRNNIGRLRHWLYNNGFSVKNEKLVREGRFICEVITAAPVEVAVTRSMGPERIEYEYPHTLIKFQGPLTREYLSTKLRIEKNILSGMMSSAAVLPKELRSQEYRIEYIERLMRKL